MYSSPVWSHPTPPYLRGLRFEQTLNLYYQRMIPHKSLLTIWFLKRRSLQISFCKILHTHPPPPQVSPTPSQGIMIWTNLYLDLLYFRILQQRLHASPRNHGFNKLVSTLPEDDLVVFREEKKIVKSFRQRQRLWRQTTEFWSQRNFDHKKLTCAFGFGGLKTTADAQPNYWSYGLHK